MKATFKNNYSFIIPYLITALIVSYILIIKDKSDIQILINSNNHPTFDIIFKYITHLGDGIFAVIIIVALLFVKVKWSVILGVAFIASSLFLQFIKRIIFYDVMRPKFFFEHLYSGDYSLHFIQGVDPGIHGSFPSGHTATAFTIFFFFALISKRNYIKIIYFILASMVAYSRIYLSWHFLPDTLAGSFIGLIFVFFIYIRLNKNQNKKFNSRIYLRKRSNSD